jgi:hypothetical protein
MLGGFGIPLKAYEEHRYRADLTLCECKAIHTKRGRFYRNFNVRRNLDVSLTRLNVQQLGFGVLYEESPLGPEALGSGNYAERCFRV